MFVLKYYEKIEEAQHEPTSRAPGATPDFDFDKSPPLFQRLLGRVASASIKAGLWFFRTFLPNPRIFRLVIVTRAADVREVLKNDRAFEVPFGPEMIELGGENTVLAMDDCPHRRLRGQIVDLMKPEDEERVRKDTAVIAQALIANAGGRLDVIGDLFTRCATESCGRYFGLEIENPVAFADWTMAMSGMLFADPFGKAETRAKALYASQRMREAGRRAVAAAHRGPTGADTLAERFVVAQKAHPDLTDARICATLVGTTTGYIPTTALAAGKMLEALLERPDAWRMAREAALAKDRDKLQAIVFEAGRLNPALLGQWRHARTNAVIAPGTWRRREVRKGDVLLVATSAALSDGRQYPGPRDFRPDRNPCPELMFGWGPHYCLGERLAKVMITEVFLHLLSLEDLRPAVGPAGKLRNAGPYPRQMDMEFTPPNGRPARTQTMAVVCAPLTEDVEWVRAQVAQMGNPAQKEIREALEKTDVIHFASLTVADLGEAGKPAHHLLLEVNADGGPTAGLEAIAQAAGAWLRPLFDQTPGGKKAGLLSILKRYRLPSHDKPWSMTHLNFNGIDEFPVPDIDRHDKLAEVARRAVAYYTAPHMGVTQPAQVLRFVRRILNGDPALQQKAEPGSVLDQLLKDGKPFRPFLVQPTRRRLKLADWVDISINEARWRTVKSKDAQPLRIAFGFVAGIVATFIVLATGGWDVHFAARLFLAVVVAVVGETLLLGLLGFGAFLLLRAKEKSDPHDARHVDFDHLQACTANEDAPGYAHNHFVATPTLKPGLFRRLTLGAALWGIGTLIVHGFRPGFVLNMGTIHYAKWFRPPGSRRLVFYGHYDGSWESYLEDFITKAHLGQTAGWSNCEGFPPTKGLVGLGAQDGDRFKRWVRRQQIPSGFWFSRFPHLTTEAIRNNALIHHGLIHARTDSAARAWLACFGSQQRPESTLETHEIQSTVFHGFGKLKYAACAVLTLPDDPACCQKWLRGLTGTPTTLSRPSAALRVTFGSAPGDSARDSAAFVAFSAEGLRKLGLPTGDCNQGDGLATFPGAFRLGMSGRSRTLGDDGEDAPQHWLWTDNATGAAPGSDAVLMLYANAPAHCEAMLKAHLEVLGQDALQYFLPTAPAFGEDLSQEHFGFRDAVSQPVIRGTERFEQGEEPEDVLEPGEFILGYRSNQGFFPPSPVVHSDTDAGGTLATAQAESPRRFPIFAEGPHGSAFHDFGRNGSYLVLRQFEQHVDQLEDFATEAVEKVNATYPGLETATGVRVAPDWVKAKLVGRWPNGVSLLDRPNFDGKDPKRPKNDFAFGRDDPQGVRCPLGAHTRRANPRDSLDPGDARGRDITNRHRLLRRGRSYTLTKADGAPERGLLFACLCADLERQFEFVQQTWINSSSFHGLSGEADPLLRGHKTPSFTIPTTAGTVVLEGLKRFVTVKGGGYYFLPSRSALVYLANRCSVEGGAASQIPAREDRGWALNASRPAGTT